MTIDRYMMNYVLHMMLVSYVPCLLKIERMVGCAVLLLALICSKSFSSVVTYESWRGRGIRLTVILLQHKWILLD